MSINSLLTNLPVLEAIKTFTNEGGGGGAKVKYVPSFGLTETQGDASSTDFLRAQICEFSTDTDYNVALIGLSSAASFSHYSFTVVTAATVYNFVSPQNLFPPVNADARYETSCSSIVVNATTGVIGTATWRIGANAKLDVQVSFFANTAEGDVINVYFPTMFVTTTPA
jgi:hypothetical protein